MAGTRNNDSKQASATSRGVAGLYETLIGSLALTRLLNAHLSATLRHAPSAPAAAGGRSLPTHSPASKGKPTQRRWRASAFKPAQVFKQGKGSGAAATMRGRTATAPDLIRSARREGDCLLIYCNDPASAQRVKLESAGLVRISACQRARVLVRPEASLVGSKAALAPPQVPSGTAKLLRQQASEMRYKGNASALRDLADEVERWEKGKT